MWLNIKRRISPQAKRMFTLSKRLRKPETNERDRDFSGPKIRSIHSMHLVTRWVAALTQSTHKTSSECKRLPGTHAANITMCVSLDA